MKTWGQRIRASLAMGLAWGAVWAVAGFLLARVPGFYSDLPFALLFAPLGVAAGILFSAISGGVERGRGLKRMWLWRVAGWGATSGLLLTGIIVAGAALRGEALWKEFRLFGPPLTAASALCAAGSLAIARWTGRRALPADSRLPGS